GSLTRDAASPRGMLSRTERSGPRPLLRLLSGARGLTHPSEDLNDLAQALEFEQLLHVGRGTVLVWRDAVRAAQGDREVSAVRPFDYELRIDPRPELTDFDPRAWERVGGMGDCHEPRTGRGWGGSVWRPPPSSRSVASTRPRSPAASPRGRPAVPTPR